MLDVQLKKIHIRPFCSCNYYKNLSLKNLQVLDSMGGCRNQAVSVDIYRPPRGFWKIIFDVC